VAFIVALILTLIALIVCAACYILCVILCILSILVGGVNVEACIEAWCQGLPRESDEEPPVDPQHTEPFDPGGGSGPLAGGGGLRSSAVRRDREVVRDSSPILVNDPTELRQINTWRRVLGGPSHVILKLPGVGEKDAKRWQTQINKQIAACGCSEGATVMLTAILAYAGWIAVWAERPLAYGSLARVGLVVAIGGGLIGKALGLFRARARLSAILRDLEAAARVKT
jgi:hypothetical protein